MNNNEMTKYLNEICNESGDSIKKAVAQEALSYTSDELTSFFNDLLKFGCQSGMISILIYYDDTHQFFQKHYAEIEEIRQEYEDCNGIILQPQGDLMNWYSWFAFEEIARRLAMHCGIL